jgi:hypothetical protein
MHYNKALFLAVSLIGFSVLSRIVPHPWNMTPVAAATIFGGVYLGRRYAIAIALLSMFLGDLVIGFYNPKIAFVVYLSMLLVAILSHATRAKSGFIAFAARPVLAAILFFLTTNAAVCFFGTMYPHTFSGLLSSYVMGLPFFARDLVGNLLYTSLFFGAYEYARKGVPSVIAQRFASH